VTARDARAALLAAVLVLLPQDPADGAGPPVPDFDAEGMKPFILETLRAAQADVREHRAEPEAWYALGALFDAHRLYEGAETCYGEAARLAPDVFRYAYLHAVIADLCGRPLAESTARFERARALDPEYAALWLNEGRLCARRGEPERARAAYGEALRLVPDYGAAHLGLGQLLLTVGEPELALEHLERAAAEAPDDQAVNAALASAYMRRGDRTRARSAAAVSKRELHTVDDRDPIRMAVEEQSVNIHTTFDRGKRRLAEGDFAGAIRDFEIFLSGRPDTAAAHGLLGEAYLKSGQAAKALEHLGRAVQLEPDDPGRRVTLAKLLLLGRPPDLDGAEGHLKAALAAEPRHAGALSWTGCLLTERGRFQEAVAHFERSTIGYAADAFELFTWARALRGLGRREDAAGKLELALTKSPRSAQTHWMLAEVLGELGRIDEAIEHYQQAGELQPALPWQERIRALRDGGDGPR